MRIAEYHCDRCGATLRRLEGPAPAPGESAPQAPACVYVMIGREIVGEICADCVPLVREFVSAAVPAMADNVRQQQKVAG